jgi:DNA-binding HxlR family transcriptional regulator
MTRRSDCPISNVLDVVGDKWSLLVLRDLMFFGKHSFTELQNSNEGVATNILTKRLESLDADGLINKTVHPQDKRKKVYTLTDKGLSMLPILLEMMIWSSQYDPNTDAPPAFIERARHDRDKLVEEIYAHHASATAS